MVEGARSPHPIEVVWEGGKRYRGGLPGGPTLLMDGDRQEAPSPVDSLIVSLAVCSAIDVVAILEKRRTPASSLSVRIQFSRAKTPPCRLTDASLHFTVATESERRQVERAIELSMNKYCSVANSLAPDIALSWSVDLLSPASEVPA